MSVRKRVLVTGATGFLGSHLAARFLAEGHAVVALARSSKTASARDRVFSAVQNAHDRGDLDTGEFGSLLHTVEGDIATPGLGLSAEGLREVLQCDEIWHSAASLSFQDEDRDEIFRMNVEGIRNILDVSRRLPSRRLHHVSTAYVAGCRTGVVLESEIFVGQKFKNAYEESKNLAEQLVAEAHASGSVRATVHRPSVVVGDARTGRVTHFHGVYVFVRGLASALDRVRRKAQTNGVVHLDLRVPGVASSTLNFVPIDFVTEAMFRIGAAEDSPGRTYHLTNPTPTLNRDWLQHVCSIFRVEGIRFATPQEFAATPPSRLEALFQRQMTFYYQYLTSEPIFDRRNTGQALAGTSVSCPEITSVLSEKMMGWYVRYLEEAKSL